MDALTIESIELINFMCHSHTTINFSKMITCIGGRNGSGKSAVMIALGLLFGQRATQLERGNSYKNLIKTGTNQSIIRVIVNNHNKFKMSRYGSKITIEKKLRHNSSTLNIYGSNGLKLKINKYELDLLSDAYCLKFDNPLNFLTQEQSKKFLNVNSPSDLYELYYRGTEFKDIQESIEEINKMLEQMKGNLEETKVLREEASAELEIQLDKLNFLNVNHEKILEDLEREEAWRKINDKQEEFQEMKIEIEKIQNSIDSKEKEKNKLMKAREEKFIETSAENLEKEVEILIKDYQNIENDLNECNADIKEKREKIEKIKHKSNLDQLKSELEQVKKDLSISREYFSSQLEEEKNKAEIDYEKEKLQNEEITKKKFALQKQLDYFQKNAEDPHTLGLKRQFNKANEEITKHKFKDTVIGPLCEYVNLKESKWYKTASIVLKNSLFNYLVFNEEDKKTLAKIFKDSGLNFGIVQQSSKKPITNYRKNNKFKTLLDVLELKNDLVKNQLIIIHNVEQTILIEDRELAYSVIRTQPVDVECAYTLAGDRIKCVGGSLSDYKARDDGKYWFEDKKSKITGISNEILKLNPENTNKIKLINISDQYNKVKANIDELENKKKDLEFKIVSLKDLKEHDYMSIERTVNVLESQAKALSVKVSQIKTKIEDKNNEIKYITKTNSESKKEFIKRQDLLFDSITRLEGEICTMEAEKGNIIRKQREISVILTEQIEVAGDQILNPRSLEEISREKRLSKERLQTASKMENKEDIKKRVKLLKNQINSYEKKEKKFCQSVATSEASCKKRIVKRDEIKDKKTIEAAMLFREYTSINGYEGHLEFDHEGKKIHLGMRVHNAEFCGSKSTLSGGERSYAGICFLLSLWKSFRCPVKILDEFDVFMDSVNRKAAIKILFDFFKQNKIQVILITPLDTKDLVDQQCEIKVLNRNVD